MPKEIRKKKELNNEIQQLNKEILEKQKKLNELEMYKKERTRRKESSFESLSMEEKFLK